MQHILLFPQKNHILVWNKHKMAIKHFWSRIYAKYRKNNLKSTKKINDHKFSDLRNEVWPCILNSLSSITKQSVRVLSKQFNEIKKRFIYTDRLHCYSNNVTHVIPIWYSKHKKQIWQKWWSIDISLVKIDFFFHSTKA